MRDIIWQPTQEWIERTNVWRFMQKLGFADQEAFLRWSTDHLEEFWDAMVREVGIEWFTPYERVLDASRGIEWTQWFVGGRLNIAHNCVDRHARQTPERLALVYENEAGETVRETYAQLAARVDAVARGLQRLGLQPGDRVAVCLPLSPLVVHVLYACLKRGFVFVPIFSGYGTEAIRTRLEDSGARVLFSAQVARRRGKEIALAEKVREACQETPLETIVMWHNAGALLPRMDREVPLEEFLHNPVNDDECATLPLESEAPALLLYTSGTTGKPKGAVHTHAGALAQMTKEIYLAFDHQDTDLFWWLTDIGWMMGPWTIIGNHHLGGAIFLYDGAPDHPAPDRLWDMAARHGVTMLGLSPTAVRLLIRRGSEPARYDLSKMRLLGSTGEPWDETSYRWYFEQVGGSRCPVINISGGTEIVGCFLFPLPIQALKPMSLGGPAPGMATECVDEQGQPVRGKKGYLVCTKPSPSMTRGIWGDPARYIETYWSRFPGMWYHGDWASVEEDGHWYLHGRADESLKVAGRKVGPAEIEDCLTAFPGVAEAAAVGVPDDLTGEAIVAFVVPKPGPPLDLRALEAHLVHAQGPTLRPRALHAVKELPKTQSGKVVRRLIRQQYLGQELGDLSTVDNPGCLEQFRAPHPSPL